MFVFFTSPTSQLLFSSSSQIYLCAVVVVAKTILYAVYSGGAGPGSLGRLLLAAPLHKFSMTSHF